MRNNLNRLFDRATHGSSFMKAVTTLLSGTALSLVIAYLAQPILTRLYTPEAFGLFDTFVSFVALLIPFASFRYEDAIMLPDEDEEALGVLGLSFFLVIIVAGLSLSLSFLANRFAWWPDYPGLIQCLAWVPPTLIAVRFSKLTELWLTRKKRYRTISAGQVIQTGTMASIRIGLSKVTASHLPFGLIWGYIAGHFVSMLIYFWQIVRTQAAFFGQISDVQRVKAALHRYKRFPLFSVPSTLLNTLLSRLPFILILIFFDEATVGYFGRAFALFAVPLSLVGGAIAQVFFVEGTVARREATLHLLAEKVHSRLVTIGLFPTLALMLTGPEVFGFVLGSNWTTAGEYLLWLAPWFFLAGIASPLTRTFDILEKQNTDLKASIIVFVVQTSMLLAGCFTNDIVLALILLSTGGALARLIHITVILWLAGVSFNSALSPYLQQTLVALPFLLILYLIQTLGIAWLTTLGLGVMEAGFLFAVYRKTVRE